MKLPKFANLLVIGLVLMVAATGCKKKPYRVTALPENGARSGNISDPSKSPAINDSRPIAGNNERPVDSNTTPQVQSQPTEYAQGGPDAHAGWPRNEEIFKSDTVHFDFDSSVVKASEKTKVTAVGDYLKANPSNAVEIQGHCDERGTEEYNRALGERRALAIREELIRLGIEPGRADTISYGKDRPEDPGHNEEAWRKNRRGAFILLTPPAKP